MFRGQREFSRRQDPVVKVTTKSRAQLLEEARRERENRQVNKRLESAAIVIQAAYRSHRARTLARKQIRAEFDAEFAVHAKCVTQEAQAFSKLDFSAIPMSQGSGSPSNEEISAYLFANVFRKFSRATSGERLLSLLRKFLFSMDPRRSHDLDVFRALCKLVLIDFKTATTSAKGARSSILQTRFLGSLMGIASLCQGPELKQCDEQGKPSVMDLVSSVMLTSALQWSAFVLLRVVLKLCFMLAAAGHLPLESDDVSVYAHLAQEILGQSRLKVAEMARTPLPDESMTSRSNPNAMIPFVEQSTNDDETKTAAGGTRLYACPSAYQGFHMLLASHVLRTHPGDMTNDPLLGVRFNRSTASLDLAHVSMIHVLQSPFQRPIAVLAVLARNPLAAPFTLPGLTATAAAGASGSTSTNSGSAETQRLPLIDCSTSLYPSPRQPLNSPKPQGPLGSPTAISGSSTAFGTSHVTSVSSSTAASQSKRKSTKTQTELALGLDLSCPSLHRRSLAHVDPCTFGGVAYLLRQTILCHLRLRFRRLGVSEDPKPELARYFPFPFEPELNAPTLTTPSLWTQSISSNQKVSPRSALALTASIWESVNAPSEIWSKFQAAQSGTHEASVLERKIGQLLAIHQYLIDQVFIVQVLTVPFLLPRLLLFTASMLFSASQHRPEFAFSTQLQKRLLSRLAAVSEGELVPRSSTLAESTSSVDGLLTFLRAQQSASKPSPPAETQEFSQMYAGFASQIPLVLVSSTWNEQVEGSPPTMSHSSQWDTWGSTSLSYYAAKCSSSKLASLVSKGFNTRMPTIARKAATYFPSLAEVPTRQTFISSPMSTAPLVGRPVFSVGEFPLAVSRLSATPFVHSMAHPFTMKLLLTQPNELPERNKRPSFHDKAPNSTAAQLLYDVTTLNLASTESMELRMATPTTSTPSSAYDVSRLLPTFAAVRNATMQKVGGGSGDTVSKFVASWTLARLGSGMESDYFLGSNATLRGVRYTNAVLQATKALKRDALGFAMTVVEPTDTKSGAHVSGEGSSSTAAFQRLHDLPNSALQDLLTLPVQEEFATEEMDYLTSTKPSPGAESVVHVTIASLLRDLLETRWSAALELAFGQSSSRDHAGSGLRDVDRKGVLTALQKYAEVADLLVARAQSLPAVHLTINMFLLLTTSTVIPESGPGETSTQGSQEQSGFLSRVIAALAPNPTQEVKTTVQLSVSDLVAVSDMFSASAYLLSAPSVARMSRLTVLLGKACSYVDLLPPYLAQGFALIGTPQDTYQLTDSSTSSTRDLNLGAKRGSSAIHDASPSTEAKSSSDSASSQRRPESSASMISEGGQTTPIPLPEISGIERSHLRLYGSDTYARFDSIARSAARRNYIVESASRGSSQRGSRAGVGGTLDSIMSIVRGIISDDASNSDFEPSRHPEGYFTTFDEFLASLRHIPLSNSLHRRVQAERDRSLRYEAGFAFDFEEEEDADSTLNDLGDEGDATTSELEAGWQDQSETDSLWNRLSPDTADSVSITTSSDATSGSSSNISWSLFRLQLTQCYNNLMVPNDTYTFTFIEDKLLPLSLHYEEPVMLSTLSWISTEMLSGLAWSTMSNSKFANSAQGDMGTSSQKSNPLFDLLFDNATSFALHDLGESATHGGNTGVSQGARDRTKGAKYFCGAIWRGISHSRVITELIRTPASQPVFLPVQRGRLIHEIELEIKRVVSLLVVFCMSYREVLQTVDDYDFFADMTPMGMVERPEKQGGRKVSILALQDHITLVRLLVSIIERISVHGTWPPQLITTDGSTSVSRKMVVTSAESQQLQASASTLLKHLWKRNLRRAFVGTNTWLIPESIVGPLAIATIAAEPIESLMQNIDYAHAVDQSHGDDALRAQALRPQGREPRRHSNALFTLIRETPFMIPFKVRLKLFEKFSINLNPHFGMRRITIDRRNILGSALRAFAEPCQHYRVDFVNLMGLPESGIDGGGLWKDFLTEFWKHVTRPELGLFEVNSQGELYPQPLYCWYPANLNDPSATSLAVCLATSSARNYGLDSKTITHLELLRICGFLAGKGATSGILVAPRFARFFLQVVQGIRNTIDDLPSRDAALYRSMMKLRGASSDVIQALDLEFIMDVTHHGHSQVASIEPFDQFALEASEGGVGSAGSTRCVIYAKPVLGASDYDRYCKQHAHHLLNTYIALPALAFRIGLGQALNPKSLRLFSAQELSIVLAGNESIDLDDLQHNCEITGLSPDAEPVRWFWEILHEFEVEDLQLFLKFATGSPRGPLTGFGSLTPRLGIRFLTGNEAQESLPTAATCANLFRIPAYRSKAIMKAKLLYAIRSNTGIELT